MEKPRRMWTVALSLVALLGLSAAIESPQYSVVHQESDFEIRLYRESTWMTAHVDELSFQKATLLGFHRLFQFIQGANLNYSRVAMTSPVVTSIVPGSGPFHSSSYSVRFYLPVKFQDDPPTPLPQLGLEPYRWDAHCVAVRKFSGYAKDDNVVKEAEKLASSLSRSPWALPADEIAGYAYSIAQYDSPFHFIGRVNEVWADVKGSVEDDCGCSSGVAAAATY
ncbi:Heme-binding protein 2 [Linum grandiflorum]